jgi:hypothetical protein
MATGFYLLDHPNRYPQTRPRNAWGWSRPTGLVTVHVAVSALDAIAPDTGAENVAAFIANRGDAGGYHVLVDSDSVVHMAPDGLMTWHTAAGNLNGPGWGISAACRPDDWNPNDPWTQKTIALMGREIRAFWERQGIDVHSAARWLSAAEGLNGRIPGVVHHGVVQPGDRFDAWVKLSNGRPHPHRQRLDDMLIAAILGGAPTPAKEWDEMASKDEIAGVVGAEFDKRAAWWSDRDKMAPTRAVIVGDDPRQWLIFPTEAGLRRVHITSPGQRELLIQAHILADTAPVKVDPRYLGEIAVAE